MNEMLGPRAGCRIRLIEASHQWRDVRGHAHGQPELDQSVTARQYRLLVFFRLFGGVVHGKPLQRNLKNIYASL